MGDPTVLETMMRGEKLARPTHPYGSSQRSDGRRDPSPLWDTWFESFTPTDRRRLVAFTSPGGISPDQLAGELDCSVSEALWRWKSACELSLESLVLEPLDVVAWRDSDTAAVPADIVGPQEIAQWLEVKTSTVWQWRKRDLLPEPARVISGVPLWTRGAIDTWALETGRVVEMAAF